MRILRVVPIVCLALLQAACATTAKTTTATGEEVRTGLFATYDRVKGETDVASMVFYKVPMLGPAVGLDLHAMYGGDTQLPPSPLPHVIILFRSTTGTQTSTWQFLKSNDLHLLLNGTDRIKLEGVHDGSVGTILLKEAIAFAIPTPDLQRVGAASTVEGILGNWRFDLKPEEIAKVREMAMFASRDPNAPIPPRRVR